MNDACVLNVEAMVKVCPATPVDFSAIIFLTIAFWAVIAVLVIGYILNIAKMARDGQYDPKFGLRTIGVFIPFIGGVVGYI